MQIWKGLKKELDLAKKNRNISIKVVIRECEASRSHFNKVVSGERKPGKGLIKKLSKSLEISEDYIHELLSKKIEIKAETSNFLSEKTKRKTNKNTYAVIIICFSFVIVYVLYSYVFNIDKFLTIPTQKEPKIIGDSTSFIKDVTIPDGSYVFTNSKFKKIWRLKNSGVIPWKGRYLMRITPFSDVTCKSDFMIPVKDTPVGKEVDIEVNFTSMDLVGSCRTDWKMVDKNKNAFFPNKHSLYSEIHVTNNKALISSKNP